jgi:thioredoxin-like negative regulator of GroEL
MMALFRQSTVFMDEQLNSPGVQSQNVLAMAQICAALGNLAKLETVLDKLVALNPGNPEARYDLAALEAINGKTDAALKDLRICVDESSRRLATNPAANNIVADARKDPRFNSIRDLPEFQKIVPPI